MTGVDRFLLKVGEVVSRLPQITTFRWQNVALAGGLVGVAAIVCRSAGMDFAALLVCTILAIVLFFWRASSVTWWRRVNFVLALLLSCAMLAHVAPGFERVLLAEHIFGANSSAWVVSWDKPLAAALVLLFASASTVPAQRVAWWWVLLSIFALFGFAHVFALHWQPKSLNGLLLGYWGAHFWLTCLAEEAVFRLLIQRPLFDFWQPRWPCPELGAIGVTAMVFMCAHLAWVADLSFLVFVFIAGLIYAYVYQRSQSVLLSALVHWSVNVLHKQFY